MRFLFAALVCSTLPLCAGPVEFGRAELEKAIRDRGLRLKIEDAIAPGDPESYSVTGTRVTGADPRGLMYGLLAAAEQIRLNGKITPLQGAAKNPIRGIRYFLHNADLERDWYYSKKYWDEYLSMLARNHFNRFNLVFAHQTHYLAPPYPFWLDVPEFPNIKAIRLTPAQQKQNLEILQYISQGAADRGIDFTLGVWQHDAWRVPERPPQVPMARGITRENVGPYSYAALKRILELCPAIKAVQMRTNAESGITTEQQIDFYKNYVFRAIRETGRILDLRAWIVVGGMVQAAREAGVPIRLSTKYWSEDLGRPYPPAETYPSYSYLAFLEKPRPYKFYFELWGLGSHRLLLWGHPDYVRRAAATFTIGGAEGFEIDAPLAQKGYGNQPGKWGVFTNAEKERAFWNWEFERYWMFYKLWGRLSYDPAAPESVWMDELRQRFGAAAPDVMAAYDSASQVINEIVAVHLADPNMYIWPEINPGGLVDSYRDVLSSDWRYVASILEAVRNRIEGTGSAKQTAFETAARLEEMARGAEEAVARASKKIPARNREWMSSMPDFQTLAGMARYHAHKQRAAYLLAYFDRTADAENLAAARRELEQGIAVWENLLKTTEVYPTNMAFGPDDVGHWRDKLPYVRHDLALVDDREDLLSLFGRFFAGFDFGGTVSRQPRPAAYRQNDYVLRNTEAPRFTAADNAKYSDEAGFGWAADGQREIVSIALTPYHEVRAVARDPKNLPSDVLFRDYIRGRGPQVFAVKAPAGEYEALLLHPDRSVTRQKARSENGRLSIAFPAGEWEVAGLVIKPAQAPPVSYPPPVSTERIPRPEFRHQPPATVRANTELSLTLSLSDPANVRAVRLHYRPVNQLVPFKTIEAAPGAAFTIPASDITARWDFMYYFEVIHRAGGGWFHPDPLKETPYFVVNVTPGS